MSKTTSALAARRSFLSLGLAAALAPLGLARAARGPTIEVWKDENCGCCGAWVEHMRAAGFEATVHDVADLQAIKAANGVPASLQSCHTARVGGYVVEGHVPAADVRRLLAERPRARGLAVPGMPPSSPGMDIPGTPYEVVLFGTSGNDRVWARH
ncbi:hypothetical protein ROTAS13_01651 [Roseomonas sp. TAS13]|uniref:Metal-binding protein n=2 Tax=Muricoccus pecuniae TaxID=693023 RepID=A0A840Y775_9PROT|nr:MULTISPECIES: DUF411 domain-containing protein [Roseomonas]MBB5696585.1 hypothetical protein [Roseomonas pecuniae]PZR09423.1 MAG: DUF411 domain-containing protein [Azospirillum brasilense]MDT8355979.1 DUF411 domain-containing protein [Roseomonas mucosa]USQ74512.1 DUF411 domain-containing protein [Roseomonas mucosa]GAV33991.1 hypothetical protein ROTAS13_01651 [Roseomonas sp. TAS13]